MWKKQLLSSLCLVVRERERERCPPKKKIKEKKKKKELYTTFRHGYETWDSLKN
jgi:hypothetical protein